MQAFFKQAEDGTPIREIRRKTGVSDATLNRIVANLRLGKAMLQGILANRLLSLFGIQN